MKYYSHYGHKDFILCLGHKGEAIKRFFLSYNEALSSDFILADGGRSVELLSADFSDWRITFSYTGAKSMIGERLLAVREHVKGEEVFLANYVDGLTDLDLNMVIDRFLKSNKTACFVSVPPTQTFHLVETDSNSRVTRIKHAETSDKWINGGYFVLRQRIFDYIRAGEDLVDQPFHRLIQEGELITFKHTGFWACMDTFKERQQLEDLWSKGAATWQVWVNERASSPQLLSRKQQSCCNDDVYIPNPPRARRAESPIYS